MYQSVLKPLLFLLDPEKAHHFVINSCLLAKKIPGFKELLKSIFLQTSPVEYMGLTFPNRIGLAAGLDKNAQIPDVFHALGYGFVEIGTVTPKGQAGNPKPRLFRVPKDHALINRMGFNNDGAASIRNRLAQYSNRKFILGGNIGKNTLTQNEDALLDYKNVFDSIYEHVDYVVLNVSCPNVANLGQLQNKDYLSSLMQMMLDSRKNFAIKKPLVVKLSPDLTEETLNETLSIINDLNFDGVIASNTTTSRENLTINQNVIDSIGNGGLSGKPLFAKNLDKIAHIKKSLNSNITLIGCGGIASADDAQRMYDAGADLLQVYSSFIYQGPKLIKNLASLHK